MSGSLAQEVVEGLKEAGVTFLCILPDSRLADVYEAASADPALQVISCANEWEGVTIAAGAWLGGKKSAMVMENSGLRVASEPLARLGHTNGLPVLLVMSYRGDMGDKMSWSTSMGWTTEPMLKALRIPYLVVREPDGIRGGIRNAQRTLEASQFHSAVLLGGDMIW
jgi:sulfopyruvate decarboxylase subunit alpha